MPFIQLDGTVVIRDDHSHAMVLNVMQRLKWLHVSTYIIQSRPDLYFVDSDAASFVTFWSTSTLGVVVSTLPLHC